uniref:Tyrosine-protein phosphatase domain-containing protein n=1 Tax=Ditylenchus dipsaci TaxID=166011 RepID=A0A915EAE5_9BILA
MNEFVDHATTSGWRKLRDEFDEIKGSREQPDDSLCKAWKQSKGKNRYSNVKCLDATRVKLTFNVPPESDYINASHVQMKGCDRKFIATQCPLPELLADFWRMVYQEERQRKSYQYWPTQEQPEKLFDGAEEGQILVTNKKSKKCGKLERMLSSLVLGSSTVPLGGEERALLSQLKYHPATD